MANKNKPLHILHVEDINLDREIFKDKFKKADFPYKLTICGSSEEALKLIDTGTSKFDIAVIDHGLPGSMTGLELCKAIKAKAIDLSLVLLTGTEEIAVEAFKIGVDEYIIKGSEVHQHALTLHIRKAFLNNHERSKRIKAEKKLHLFKKALDTTHMGVTITDPGGTITYSNPADEKMHGYSPMETLGMKGKQFSLPNFWQPWNKEEIDGIKTWGRESVNVRKDKSTFPVYLISDAIKDESDEVIAIVTCCTDISIQKQAEEELKRSRDELEEMVSKRTTELKEANYELNILAITDGLTGAHNQRYFYERLESELERSERYSHPTALMISDVDDFKHYNDKYGHLAGDKVLRVVAECIRKAIRSVDVFARYGGEEFAVIMPETDLDKAAIIAERVRNIIEEEPFPDMASQPLGKITVSIGIASYSHGADTPKNLVKKADEAMYRAKSLGKNRVEIKRESLSQILSEC